MSRLLRRLTAAVLCLMLTVGAFPFVASAADIAEDAFGDVSGDSDTSLLDALMIFQYINGKITLGPLQYAAADLNADGSVTLVDALTLFQYINGQGEPEPVPDGPGAGPTVAIREGVTDESTFMQNIAVRNSVTGNVFYGKTKEELQLAVANVVKWEVGSSFFGKDGNSETWKVFAVAAYSLLARHGAIYGVDNPYTISLQAGNEIDLTDANDKRIYDAVGEVLGIKIGFADASLDPSAQLCQIYYSACSAGETCSTLTAWGYHEIPYVKPVESYYDTEEFITSLTGGYDGLIDTFEITMDELLECVKSYFSKDEAFFETDPNQPYDLYAVEQHGSYWFNTNVWVYDRNGNKSYVTGTELVNVLIVEYGYCRSAAFEVIAQTEDGVMTVQTKGHGHGIGISQYGAAGYALEAGWTYDQIIAHYYNMTDDTEWGLIAPKWQDLEENS